jgi:RNA polymerase sigma-70 factor (ECF subfamily)
MTAPDPMTAIEAAARDSYSQLLSFVASWAGGDLAGAEDALGEAFQAALLKWPVEGVPERPEAWLASVARRRLIDSQRRERTRGRSGEALRTALETAARTAEESEGFPDDRLKLLFVCAHPAIDPSERAPLSLQVVLGISPERIASAFLVSPAAMKQRLVRVKRKIRDARIPFEVPPPDHWPARFSAVLEAIYVAFTAGWDAGGGGQLAEEAIRLGRLLVNLAPHEPEALGLLSLMLHCDARKAARSSAGGAFIPLGEQNVSLWSGDQITEADAMLRRAAGMGGVGRFQLEAAIQSVHAARKLTGKTEWGMIIGFYEMLLRLTEARGARIAHAIAIAEVHGPELGLEALEAIPHEGMSHHQPYWAVRADLLRRAGRTGEAVAAYHRAIGLTEDPAVRKFLTKRRKMA